MASADFDQLYEYPFWGPTTSNPTDDPNPRLEAYIDAARRSANAVFTSPPAQRS